MSPTRSVRFGASIRGAHSIPTVRHLRNQSRRVERLRLSASRVLATRPRCIALHCSHEKSGTHWWLSDGSQVSPPVAALVIVAADVVSTGDALFGNACGQTFRFVQAERD
jgi:hypothetical protein